MDEVSDSNERPTFADMPLFERVKSFPLRGRGTASAVDEVT